MVVNDTKITSDDKRRGFTIIELLIVIVVIAILAAITILAYNGITQKAHVTALQSDLSQSATSLGAAQATNGTYPLSQSAAGLKPSPGDTLTYNASGDGTAYCLQAQGSGVSYFVTQNNNVPVQGYCNGTTGIAGTGSPHTNGAVVSTLAGNGTSGYVNGPCSSAEFNGAQGMAVDGSGNVYVADSDNNAIRKITISPSCSVSTLAGSTSGANGKANGTGTAASFNAPSALAVDGSGNVYVADDGNNMIRKITPAGVVTTYAGTGSAGLVNGSAASAQFNDPFGIAIDSSGNLYIAERNNDDIRKISSSGTVSTFAGNGTQGYVDGPGATAEFMDPQFLAADSSGNVYVGNWSNSGWNANWVRMITPSAVVSTLAGNGTQGFVNGAAASAEFYEPSSVALDAAGNVYIADGGNNCIRKVASGTVSTFAGDCDPNNGAGHVDATGTSARFNIPWTIANDASGNLYVSDYGSNYIREIQ